MTTKCQHKCGHRPFPPCISPAAPYVPPHARRHDISRLHRTPHRGVFTHSPLHPLSPLSTPYSPLPSPLHPFTLSPLSTSYSPLPSLPAPDEALITRLFTDQLKSIQDLFATFQSRPIDGAPATLLDLCRWAAREDIKPWLDFHEAQEASSLKRKNLARLDALAESSENPIERRRASTTILRALGGGLGAHGVSRAVPAPVSRVHPPSEPRPSGSGHHRTQVSHDITTDSPSRGAAEVTCQGPELESSEDPQAPEGRHSSPPNGVPSSSALSTQHSAPPSPSFAPLTLPSPPALTARRLAFYAESAGAIPPPNPYCFAAPHSPPTSVISIIMHALMQLDSAGYITLFNLSGIEGRTNEALQAFAKRLPTLYPTKFNRFKIISERQTGDHTYTAEVEVNSPEPQKYRNAYPPHTPPSTLPPTRLTLNLQRQTNDGPLAFCWLWLWEPPIPDTS